MKITAIEKRPNTVSFGVFLLTLTDGTQTVQRAFGTKWFPTLCTALENKKIKVGDDLPGTVSSTGIFKYDPPAQKTEIRFNKKNEPYTYFFPRW